MTRRGLSVILWMLQSLFCLRVIGQIYVGLYSPAWLPPWQEWYSGLLPYYMLLPVQLIMLMWMSFISYDNCRGEGRFFIESPRLRYWLRWFAYLYAGSMFLRYVIVMSLMPEMRWFHGTIPIVFHWVLAGYLFALTVTYAKNND
jgi:hypothetical protein